MPTGRRATPLIIHCQRCAVEMEQWGVHPKKWCGACLKLRTSERGRAWAKSNPDRVNASKRARRALNPDYDRARMVEQRYGLTPEQHDALFAAQNGLCAICKTDAQGKTLNIDHCHETGKVRALLCWRCNVALGHFEDNVERILEAAAYVERHRAA